MKFDGAGALQFGKDWVKGVRGFQVGDGVLFAGGGADGDREEFIAAIEWENPIRGKVMEFRGGFAEEFALRRGIAAKLLGGDAGDGFHGFGAGRVRVFIGVEFDHAGIDGLFAGDVTG